MSEQIENTVTEVAAPVKFHEFAPTGEALEASITFYNATGKLPTYPHISCTRTGRKITMFGDNLTGRVAKFGGIRELLTTFICNDAKKADKLAGILHDDQPKSNAGFKKVGTKLTKELLELQIKVLTSQLATMPTEDTRAVAMPPTVVPTAVPTAEDLMSVFDSEEQAIVEEVSEEQTEDQTEDQIMAELEAEEAAQNQ